MLPEVRQPTTAVRLSRAVRKTLEQRQEAHLVSLAEDQFACVRAGERLQGGSDLVGLAGSLVVTMAMAEATLATSHPGASRRLTHLIDRFTFSAADVIDTYMRRPF
jgi:hypothetical protein